MKPTSVKQIARQRIQILFEQAKQVCKTNPQLAMQYIKSARKIAMAAKIRLPVEFRRETCKNCDALLVQGYNCRVRIKQKRAASHRNNMFKLRQPDSYIVKQEKGAKGT